MKSTLYYRDPNGRIVLVCPNCGEELSPLDVEIYPGCPYCNWNIPVDDDLEEFILDPIVRNWASRVTEGL